MRSCIMKHAIFDLGNVLIDYDLGVFYRRIHAACEQPIEKIEADYNSDELAALEVGAIQMLHYSRMYRFEWDLKWFPEDWAENYGACYSLNSKGLELAKKAKDKGFSISILSNLAIFHKKGVEGRFPGFFENYDNLFFSFELGVAKPDRGIYEKVCAELGASAEQCLFLDDKPENIEGAKAFGMKGIVFEEGNFGAIEEVLG